MGDELRGMLTHYRCNDAAAIATGRTVKRISARLRGKDTSARWKNEGVHGGLRLLARNLRLQAGRGPSRSNSAFPSSNERAEDTKRAAIERFNFSLEKLIAVLGGISLFGLNKKIKQILLSYFQPKRGRRVLPDNWRARCEREIERGARERSGARFTLEYFSVFRAHADEIRNSALRSSYYAAGARAHSL